MMPITTSSSTSVKARRRDRMTASSVAGGGRFGRSGRGRAYRAGWGVNEFLRRRGGGRFPALWAPSRRGAEVIVTGRAGADSVLTETAKYPLDDSSGGANSDYRCQYL